jgi:alkylation response protein AidB-like acyl-CoA dehydrogenase
VRFTLSEDQQEIKRTAKDLLAARSGVAALRQHAEAGTYDDALWKELSELGWPGIAVSEEHGGQGLGLVELCVLVEELGYACAAVPFLGSALAALALEQADETEWLPRLASGEARGAFGAGGTLIPDAAGADVVVVIDREGHGTLVEGSAVEVVDAIDSTRRYGEVQDAQGEPLGDVCAALGRALVVVSAELVGVSQRTLDMSIEYVKDRKQFGVPVGTFQAVQHKAAQMLLDTEGGRSATYFAAWTADAGAHAEGGSAERLAVAAASAKAWTSDRARDTTASAIQLHGGIGFTWEADVHWFYKRAQLDAAFLGGRAEHRARISQLVAAERAGATA